MLINEICKECSLTKKAIEYYEKQGLISPQIAENGYRNYTDKDVYLLKEISILRRLGLSTADIKEILSSKNKSAALSKHKYLLNLKIEKASMQQKCLENLIEDYDISRELSYIETNINPLFTIKEKLLMSFPGSYGMYLCVHFGRFLNEKIDSEEKEKAYLKIISFLDSVADIDITEEMEKYLENSLAFMKEADMDKMNNQLLSAVEDAHKYIEDNKDFIEEYMKVRASREFKKSEAYKFQQLLLDFNKTSGYYDIFIPNLKILSSSYREYSSKLHEANKLFVERYPEMKNLYNDNI
ncbi:MerR family transcriptional regulator [Clostridium sp. YIM B02515]|uniref:MerR family transcriptional regulator n=1 Tax=Clostridium rhizosphaerae TaxID=2803861 RepID=A0ABS1TCE9_9CLOT|nr:MerR family transcriptional regulator [Clostridium rhizosphaerae]MBL4937033.1 MerR family transcriptional regulator [Clostridium rhizosphaerae]